MNISDRQQNIMPGLEITAGHRCGGDFSAHFQANQADNVLKSPSSTVMTGSYFKPCYAVLL